MLKILTRYYHRLCKYDLSLLAKPATSGRVLDWVASDVRPDRLGPARKQYLTPHIKTFITYCEFADETVLYNPYSLVNQCQGSNFTSSDTLRSGVRPDRRQTNIIT